MTTDPRLDRLVSRFTDCESNQASHDLYFISNVDNQIVHEEYNNTYSILSCGLFLASSRARYALPRIASPTKLLCGICPPFSAAGPGTSFGVPGEDAPLSRSFCARCARGTPAFQGFDDGSGVGGVDCGRPGIPSAGNSAGGAQSGGFPEAAHRSTQYRQPQKGTMENGRLGASGMCCGPRTVCTA